jgi:hypothetical protein
MSYAELTSKYFGAGGAAELEAVAVVEGGGSKEEMALLRLLSQILQQKFKSDLGAQAGARKSPDPFTDFVSRYFCNKHGLPALARKHQKECVLSMAAHAGVSQRLAMFVTLLGLNQVDGDAARVSEESITTYTAILHDLSGFSPVVKTIGLTTLMRVVSAHCAFLGAEHLRSLEREVTDLCSATPHDPCSSETVLLDAALELTMGFVHSHDANCAHI